MQKHKQSIVVFDGEKHTYKIDEKYLSGITCILSKYICESKYDKIPLSILNKAKTRGKNIHQEVQMFVSHNMEHFEKSKEFESFLEITKDIQFIESEYIVTDNENFASPIDLMDIDYNLYDVKTTFQLDEKYLSWQLSILSYLFELQNGFEPNKLFGIWLNKDKKEIIEVEKIDKNIIQELLHCAKNDLPFEAPESQNKIELSDETKNRIKALEELESKIVLITKSIDQFKKDSDLIKSILTKEFESYGIKKWETDKIIVTKKDGYTKEDVDKKKLKSKYPKVYKDCEKQTNVKGSLLIKIKDA